MRSDSAEFLIVFTFHGLLKEKLSFSKTKVLNELLKASFCMCRFGNWVISKDCKALKIRELKSVSFVVSEVESLCKLVKKIFDLYKGTFRLPEENQKSF